MTHLDSPRRSRRAGIVALAVGALALGLAPAMSPAAADVVPPTVTYLDSTTRTLRAGAVDGATFSALTPATYATASFDVSQDGSTVLAGVSTGPKLANSSDKTWGLALVRRVASVTSTRILSSNWDTNPVLSADGSTAWWLESGKVYRYAAGVTSVVASSLFAPVAGEDVWRFAVSPDGTKGAVLYAGDGTRLPATQVRVLAADFSAGKGANYAEQTFTATPTPTNLAWIDNASLVYGYEAAGDVATRQIALSAGATAAPVDVPEVAGMYDLRPLAGTWWGWQDSATAPQYLQAATLTGLASATPTTTSIGLNSWWLTPSTTAPPAMTMAANRARSIPSLYLSATVVPYGRRVVYIGYAEYLQALPGQVFARDSSWVVRGLLQYSIDGRTWKSAGYTTWDHQVPWPGSTSKGAGYTAALTRNTWYRWTFPGDYVVAPSTSVVRKVAVVPTVTVAVKKYSTGKRAVYGKITRIGGLASLYRYSSGAYRRVASVRLTSKGLYTFGARALLRGRYKVTVPADASWAAASKLFTI